MHCDKCNVDFSEGLRYCKWCGGPLTDRARITGELHTCPSCSAAIQPGWAFCKTCGERLHAAREAGGAVCPLCGAPTEPGALKCARCGEDLAARRAAQSAQDSADTALIAKCSSCDERLETGSLYCKACGAAAYTEPTPFGGSALLCGTCNSYSPLGSGVCRVCSAPFVQGSRSVDFAAATTVQQKATTLPDLDEQMAAQEAAKKLEQPGADPSANTWEMTVTDRDDGVVSSRTRGNVETNLLPGTAGSRSEQQAPTSGLDMGRITGPVEDEAERPLTTSGELRPTSAPNSGDQPSPAIRDDRAEAPGAPGTTEPTVQLPGEPRRPTTSDFGSKSGTSPVGSESKTEVFVSPLPEPPTPSRKVSSDDIETRQFIPAQSPPEAGPTREFQPAKKVTAGQIAPTGEGTSAPQWTDAKPIEPTAVAEPSQSEVLTPPVAQVTSQPLPKKRTGAVIASVVVVLILIGATVYVGWLLFGRARPTRPTIPPVAVEQPPVNSEPPVAPPPETLPAPVIPEGMVAVAAGTYTIGRDGADPLEQPEHKVTMPAFFFDRTEVTNGAYKKFIDATNHKAPSNWTGTSFPAGRDDFPVTGVTWQDAADYAVWAGKRLPTEVEWEAAARGTDGRIYPWGNDYRASVANIGSKPDDITADKYPSGLKEVGRYPPGASPAGALDMIGNAWEWAEDEFALYPGGLIAMPKKIKDKMEPGLTYRVIRGGAYDGNRDHDATYRGLLDGSQAYPKVGFRCAKDAK